MKSPTFLIVVLLLVVFGMAWGITAFWQNSHQQKQIAGHESSGYVDISLGLKRIKTPDGWLVYNHRSVTYVPDSLHGWVIK